MLTFIQLLIVIAILIFTWAIDYTAGTIDIFDLPKRTFDYALNYFRVMFLILLLLTVFTTSPTIYIIWSLVFIIGGKILGKKLKIKK